MAGSSKAKMYVVGGAILAVVIVVIILIATSLKSLQSDEMALPYNTIGRVLYNDVKQEGLHSGPPGFQFIVFPAVFRTISFDYLECLNKDGVIITLNLAFQFLVSDTTLYWTILQFRNYDNYQYAIRYSAEAAIHEACSQYNTTEFQANRQEFQVTVREIIRERLTGMNCSIADLQINNIARPSEYETAVREKEAARENIQVAETERPKLLTQARTVLREAETQAEIKLDRANTDAKILLNTAEADAQAILAQYRTEAETYMKIVMEQSLTTEGLLAYMGVRAISEAANPVYAGVDAPAKTSYLGN